MKVTTKVAAGAAVLVGLLLVALARDVSLVRRLASAHRTLSEDRFTAVTSTLELLRSLELVEERLLKLSVTRDPAYRAQLDRLGAEVEVRVAGQQALALPAEELAEVERLGERWRAWRDALTLHGGPLVSADAPEREQVRASLLALVAEVREQAVTVMQVLRRGIEIDVDRAQEEARRGERNSLLFAGLAVVWGVIFVTLVVGSLNGPLSRLIAATRSVAAGRPIKLSPKGGDELSELARAFDAMVDRLDEVDRMKRDFVWSVSHELKTPLSAMQETTQLLADGLAGPLTGKQRRMLELNIDAGRRLSGMLSRMLDLSRLEAGAVTYDVRPVDLTTLLATAVQGFEARLREKSLTPTVTLPAQPIVIHGDADWLMQVFDNLLENAVKFSPPGRRLWIELALFDHAPPSIPPRLTALFADPCAVVSVADEGPGVPPEAHERIFERFFQVHRQRRVGAGVGLGLAICKDIVAAHGGGLWVSPREEEGSVFCVALPLPAVQAERLEEPRPADASDRRDAACAPSV